MVLPVKLQLLTNSGAGAAHLSSDGADPSALGHGADVGLCSNGAVQVVWAALTGTVNATLTVEASLDGGTTWDAKTGAVANLTGAAGSAIIPMAGTLVEPLLRVNYANGTVTGGTINAHLYAKP